MHARTMLLVGLLVIVPMSSGCAERLDAHGDDIRSLAKGERTLGEVANSIAGREFNPSMRIDIENIEMHKERPSDWRGKMKADRGYIYFFVTIRATNNGTVILPVATWEFSAVDDRRSSSSAITTLPHRDFDGIRIHPGAAHVGTLIFEMRDDAELTSIVWNGLLATARGDWSPPVVEPEPEAEPAPEPGSTHDAEAGADAWPESRPEPA